MGKVASLSATTLRFSDGSITDDSGSISFGDENITTTGTLAQGGPSGQLLTFQTKVTGSGAMTSGSTVTLSNAIPAASLVFGITARVTTTITGPTSWLIGVVGDTDQWGAAIALAADTTVDYADYVGTKPPEFFAAATDIVLTRGSASDFTAGVVSVTVHFIDLTAATA